MYCTSILLKMCIFCDYMKTWGSSWGNLITKYEKELSANLMFHKTKFDKTKGSLHLEKKYGKFHNWEGRSAMQIP